MTRPNASLNPHGTDLVLIAEIAPLLGLSPATLFHAGCRGELLLCRLGNRWACDLSEAQAFAEARARRIVEPFAVEPK